MDVIGSSRSIGEIDAQALAVAVFKDEKSNSGLLMRSTRKNLTGSRATLHIFMFQLSRSKRAGFC
jgi:hypothetical protein